jgi:RHS repeat-associated protein
VTTDGSGQSRSHNRQNQITSLGGATPTYDGNGNLTGDGTYLYEYDAWNRLVRILDPENQPPNAIETNVYDALNRRVSETASSTTTHFYYNLAWQVVEERVGGTGSSNVRAQYLWSPVGVDVLILRDRDTDGNGTLDERLYVQQDAQSNVTALVDTSGAVVERVVQDPYGARTILTPTWGNRSATLYAWKYYHQGLRLDATETLYDNRMRMYSPILMRFMQNDPIGFEGGDQNTYRYVGNGPVNAWDPSGLEIKKAPVESVGNIPFIRVGSQNWWENPLVAPDQGGPWSAFWGSLGNSFWSIGAAYWALFTGNDALMEEAYQAGPLGQTENGPAWVRNWTRGALGVATAATVLAVGAMAWGALGLPTFNVGISFGGPYGFHTIYGTTVGGHTVWANATGHAIGSMWIVGADSATVAGSWTLTGIPILFPAAALPAHYLTDRPDARACITAALDAFVHGLIGRR